jgi:hypothetical protein
MKPKIKTATMILRIFCAMVFLSLGFGHRMPVASATVTQSWGYSLPDGTFADLCVAGKTKDRTEPASACEACRLAGAVILPEPTDESWLVNRAASLNALTCPGSNLRLVHLLERLRLRGPPLSV